jgi:hypothetical protein
MMSTLDPRLRVLYLVAIAVGALFVKDARIAAALAGAHAVAWLVFGLGARALVRQIVKLWGFTAFIIVSYGLTAEDPSVDRWVPIDLGVAHFSVNAGGAAVGGMMVLRVLVIILASRVARAGDERAIAHGLGKLGVPAIVATSIDAVLALIGGRGHGRGGGGGDGRGRRRREEGEGPEEGFFAGLRRIARGDVGPIVDRIEHQIGRADQYFAEDDNVKRDTAIIVGLSLTMLGIKALKVLPSIPFAPGHKLVILTPLYVIAALKTRTRFGATLTGLVMGTVAFLLGDGKFGIFEIPKHIMPGLLCDALVPLVSPRRRGVVSWSILGGLMGVGRYIVMPQVVLTAIVKAPAVAWALLAPGLLIHTTFGILSGLVSAPLIRAAHRERERELETEGHEQVADG